MKPFQISNLRSQIQRRSGPLVVVAILLSSAVAGAVNVNGSGVSLNLPTTDLSSNGAQTNSAGARLVSGGTPDAGVVSTNPRGAKVIIEPMNAMAGNGAPVADFGANPLTGRAPLDVQFADLSAGGLYEILSWTWDFGDGSPASSVESPKHTYDSPGTYTVTLTITTAGGPASKTKSNYITVSQGMPTSTREGLLILAVTLAALGCASARRTLVG